MKEEVQNYLKTDSDLELVAVLTLGFPDEDLTEGCRRPLENLILNLPSR